MQFKREPALWLALISASISMVSAFFFELTIEQQGVLNAGAAAVAGLITAVMVKSDQLVPAILGAVSAVLAIGLAFGLRLDQADQATIMAFATAAVHMFVRTQVLAPVPATSSPQEEPKTS